MARPGVWRLLLFLSIIFAADSVKSGDAEFVMGEGDEAETHVITSTTRVYVPANVIHCPLEFKRVDKPIMFGHITFAPSYSSTVVGKNPLER